VCELSTESSVELENDWKGLKTHINQNGSDLALLPEMPFYHWLCISPPSDPVSHKEQWEKSVEAHEKWISRLNELNCPIVIGSRPVIDSGKFYNEAFIWENSSIRGVQRKYYLPEEPSFHESKWYSRAEKSFHPFSSTWRDSTYEKEVLFGAQVCSDMWFTEHSRQYGKQKCHVLVTPRATGKHSLDKWVVGGQAAAVVSGCWGLSSNRWSDKLFGGRGWITSPDGVVKGVTTHEQPFLTLNIPLLEAEKAKETYPRYISD